MKYVTLVERMKLKNSSLCLLVFIGLFVSSCMNEDKQQAQAMEEERIRQERMAELKQKEQEVEAKKNELKEFSTNEVTAFMRNYYHDLVMGNFDAYRYYADHVDRFISKKNVTPDEINEINRSNDEFIDKTVYVQEETMTPSRIEGKVQYFTFWIYFTCYRASKDQYQSCNVNIEVGLNENKKMISYRELKVTDLEFTDYDPNEEGD